MKYFMTFVITLVVFVWQPSYASAAPFLSFTQEDSTVVVGEYTQFFVQHEDQTETLTFAPSFRTTATEFAFIVPLPYQAAVETASLETFPELHGLVDSKVLKAQVMSTGEVDVLATKRRVVSSLTIWLDYLGYSYTELDLQILQKYLDRGDYLLLVTASIPDTALTDEEGYFGITAPIRVTFSATTPILPTATGITQDGIFNKMHSLFSIGTDWYRVSQSPIHFHQQESINCEITKSCFSTFSWVKESSSLPWLGYQTIEQNLIDGDSNILLQKGSKETIQSGLYASLFASTRLLRRGVWGDDIKDLQLFLNDYLTLDLVADGKWGPKTEVAVTVFQTNAKIKVDGIVGMQTRTLIAEMLEKR